jgi:hypothetical protein
VQGIKLEGGDVCLGGALISNRRDALTVETAGGKTMEFRRGAHPPTGRGGKGFQAVKRTTFTKVVTPAIELVDWDDLEGRDERPKRAETNGEQKSLFDD